MCGTGFSCYLAECLLAEATWKSFDQPSTTDIQINGSQCFSQVTFCHKRPDFHAPTNTREQVLPDTQMYSLLLACNFFPSNFFGFAYQTCVSPHSFCSHPLAAAWLRFNLSREFLLVHPSIRTFTIVEVQTKIKWPIESPDFDSLGRLKAEGGNYYSRTHLCFIHMHTKIGIYFTTKIFQVERRVKVEHLIYFYCWNGDEN